MYYLYNKPMKHAHNGSMWRTIALIGLVIAIAYVIYAHPDVIIGGFK